MNVFKIAWRSIQHRGLGSLLTIISMALGVMTVVAVLTIHGVVSRSFKSNSSFGYNVIIGSRGGSMQLTLNTSPTGPIWPNKQPWNWPTN
jgi:putative ABC transport system permease protein